LVDTSDVLPTVCEVAGIDLPEYHVIDGVSFAPYLRGETKPLREWVYQYLGPHRIIRTKRWLLEKNTMRSFGRLFDCGESRDGTGYRDVTDSNDPEVIAARKLLKEILADKPVPDVVSRKPSTKKGGKNSKKKKARSAP
jgi:arylsulfatase A